MLLEQISLWDAIIPSKEQAKFSYHTINKYRFTDQVNYHSVKIESFSPDSVPSLFPKHSTQGSYLPF